MRDFCQILMKEVIQVEIVASNIRHERGMRSTEVSYPKTEVKYPKTEVSYP